MLHQPIPAADVSDSTRRVADRVEASLDAQATSIIPSLKRTIKSLSVTQQLAIVQFVVEANDFADFDQHTLDKLDDALTDCMKQSIYADHAEDVKLHGCEVTA